VPISYTQAWQTTPPCRLRRATSHRMAYWLRRLYSVRLKQNASANPPFALGTPYSVHRPNLNNMSQTGAVGKLRETLSCSRALMAPTVRPGKTKPGKTKPSFCSCANCDDQATLPVTHTIRHGQQSAT